MSNREVMQQALEALENCYDVMSYPADGKTRQDKAITALRTALEQPEQEPIGWLDGDETLAEFMHKDLKAAHDRCGSATPREFTIAVYLAPPAAQPENGDIRALKYRIHELEGEVIGYKRMIEESALKKLADLGQEIEQEPVAWICYGAPGKRDIDFEESDINELPIGTHLYTAPPAAQPAPVQEPVAHSVISGALFDFMGWLTSRNQRLTLSSTDDASPAAEAITDFAKMRGLSLNDARVQDWQDTTPQPRPWVGLTGQDKALIASVSVDVHDAIHRAEAKLKEKNT